MNRLTKKDYRWAEEVIKAEGYGLAKLVTFNYEWGIGVVFAKSVVDLKIGNGKQITLADYNKEDKFDINKMKRKKDIFRDIIKELKGEREHQDEMCAGIRKGSGESGA